MAIFTAILEERKAKPLAGVIPGIVHVSSNKRTEQFEANNIDHAWDVARAKHYKEGETSVTQIVDIVAGEYELPPPEEVQPVEQGEPAPEEKEDERRPQDSGADARPAGGGSGSGNDPG